MEDNKALGIPSNYNPDGHFETKRVNNYQRSKAKHIATVLLVARDSADMTPHKLAQCVAIMTDEQWRAVCFVADQPVADLNCKAEVLRILRERV